MSEPIAFPDGGYAFVRGGFPYSQAVGALAGFAIERARFAAPVPLMRGFAAIDRHLQRIGRPRAALCAAELRSPEPFTLDGFKGFNARYVDVLKEWSLFRGELNPVARSNVAPASGPPSEPSFYAFCYTVPAAEADATFVVAGSGEWPEGGRFPEDIVARGDVSVPGLQAKARFVLDRMQTRMQALGARWGQPSAVQVYTVHDIHPLLEPVILPRTGNGPGLTWHYCRPPICELEFEMDLRRVHRELLLDAD